ncbi:transposase [Streptomyces sp. NPDC001435]|uniref:transposase n=1 Tax=unclassified Streptomyces TaxID=2593676 RepID=UPI0036997DAD
MTSEVHLLSDDRARPLTWQTSPGQRGDSPMFAPVLDGLRLRRRGPGRPRSRPDRVRGDKAYSSRDNRAYLRRRGIKATIAQPDDQRAHRRRRGRSGGRPPAFDKTRYRCRNAVERCVNKWKQFRAVATRNEERDYVDLQGHSGLPFPRARLGRGAIRKVAEDLGLSVADQWTSGRRCFVTLAHGRSFTGRPDVGPP